MDLIMGGCLCGNVRVEASGWKGDTSTIVTPRAATERMVKA